MIVAMDVAAHDAGYAMYRDSTPRKPRRCIDWSTGRAGFHDFVNRDRPRGVVTTADLLTKHVIGHRAIENDPRFAGRHYHQHPRQRRAAFFHDFRRFVSFEQRQEVVRKLRELASSRYGSDRAVFS